MSILSSQQNITLGSVGVRTQPGYQAYQILHVGYAALPIVAGLDKFFHYMVNWDMYLAPAVGRYTFMSDHHFMMVVGVIEILAGALVVVKPHIGGYVVMTWMWGIIVNLMLLRGFYDVALRDFGLSLGALALARLSTDFDASF